MRALAFACVVIIAGCGPDSSTLAGPDPEFDQKGLGGGGQPVISRFTDPFNFVIPAGEFCPSFAVEYDGQAKFIVQRFETHLVTHTNYRATLTNLETGFSIEDKFATVDVLHFSEDLGEGVEVENITFMGSLFRITIPHQGMVFQDTGIITYDARTGEVLFEGGHHDNIAGTGAPYCSLLSGGGA
jgi:hypothetical protein